VILEKKFGSDPSRGATLSSFGDAILNSDPSGKQETGSELPALAPEQKPNLPIAAQLIASGLHH
jgi:hypothetical protein